MTITEDLHKMSIEECLNKYKMTFSELFEIQLGNSPNKKINKTLIQKRIDVHENKIIKIKNNNRTVLATFKSNHDAFKMYEVLMYKLETNKYNNVYEEGKKTSLYIYDNDETYNFGTYNHKELAIMVSAKLDEYGWDKNNIPKIWGELGLINKNNRTEEANYRFKTKNGKWQVQKKFQDIVIYYGLYPSKKKAEFVVKELKKVNWDKSYLEEINKKYLY